MRAAIRKLIVAVSVAALTLGLAAVALAGVKTGSYKGTTTQTSDPNGTVKFKVSNDHKNVNGFQGLIYIDCSKAGHPAPLVRLTLDPTPDMAITSGKFGFTGHFNLDNGNVVIAHNVDGKIKGKFVTSKNVTGTMKFDWKFDSNAPAAYRNARCTTGEVDFKANHA